MRTKRVAVVSLITFLIGGVGGSAYAYVTHPSHSGDSQLALSLDLEQAHENWEVEQFISEQEELRPDGLSESKIAAGSKYTGVTYKDGKMVMPQQRNDVSTANVTPQIDSSQDNASAAPEEKKESFLSKLFGKKESSDSQQNGDGDVTQQTQTGRIAIQSGSLNVRAQSNTSSEIIGNVYKDDTVQIIGQTGAWYQITTQDGLQGYVSAAYVEVINETE